MTLRVAALRPRLLPRGRQLQRILGNVVSVLTACSWNLAYLRTPEQIRCYFLMARAAETIWVGVVPEKRTQVGIQESKLES